MNIYALYFALLISLISYAAPVGNTATPRLIQGGIFTSSANTVDLRAGYEGDFVSDGRMEQYQEGAGRVDTYKQDTDSGTVTLNIVERLDLYGVFGSSKTKADWRFTDSTDSIHRIMVKTKNNFLWGVGARAILYEWGSLVLGMGGRYSSSDYQPTRITTDGIATPLSGAQVNWRQWQINFDMGYTIHYFTPYIGFKYAHARTHLSRFSIPISSSGTGENQFKNREPVGLYLGCGFSTGKYLLANIEGRLIDEESVTLSVDLKF